MSIHTHFYRNLDEVGLTPEQQAIVELQEDIERIDEKDEEQDNRIVALENDPIHEHVVAGNFYNDDYPWYHVDSQDGSDDNDGKTWNTCLKTFDKAIELANKSGRHDLRIALLESDEPYEYSGGTIASQVLHVFGYYRNTHTEITDLEYVVTNTPVELYLTNTDRRTALYATHTNFEGLVIRKVSTPGTVIDANRELYCDGGMVLFTACAIVGTYTQNGGSCWLNNVEAQQLVFRSCEVWVENNTTLTFTTTNSAMRRASDGSLYQSGTRLYILGGVFHEGTGATITFRNTQTSDPGRYMRVIGATVFANNFEVGVCHADYDISIDNGILYLPNSARVVWQRPLISDCLIFSGNSIASGSLPPQTSWADVSKVQYTT